PLSNTRRLRRTHPSLPPCGSGPRGVRALATVPARYRHVRVETRGACKRHQPLLGGDWECETANEAPSRQETSRACTLGGDWRCTPRVGRNYCCVRLSFAQINTRALSCPRQKHRCPAV